MAITKLIVCQSILSFYDIDFVRLYWLNKANNSGSIKKISRLYKLIVSRAIIILLHQGGDFLVQLFLQVKWKCELIVHTLDT